MEPGPPWTTNSVFSYSRETAHLKELRRLLGDYADIADDWLDKLQVISGVLVDGMVELRTNVAQLVVIVDKLATKVDHFAKKRARVQSGQSR